ncbi:ATP-dependent zinc metalloprotease FtsH [Catalinimonas sp. 4WD22]|uniref:ATP-dependent zinc metalloprotease FtsH n=1 Tax=Catalinimonas locisalis TaxID=3133978 RepID=UPI0031018CD2
MNKKEKNIKQSKKGNQRPNNSWLRMLFFGLMVVFGFYFFGQSSSTSQSIGWQELKENYLQRERVQKIEVINKKIAHIYLNDSAANQEAEDQGIFNQSTNGPDFQYTLGSVETFEDKIQEAESTYNISPVNVNYVYQTNWLSSLLPWLLPIILIVFFFYFMRKRAQQSMGGGNNIFSIGKSKAKIYDETNKPSIRFNDIAGLEEAKTEVAEVVHYLRDTSKYVTVGAKIPKGMLLVGPPGTGKTMMAKAVAGEANVPFLSMSGSDFVEMFVGVGASRVRNLFKQAKEKAPCIIFIDEIDAIGRSRGKAKSLQSNDEQENTLNQLLQALDGFETNSGVIVLAATNRKDVLDKALLRPGRFDREIYLDLPNLEERKAIFAVHLKNINIKDDIKVDVLAAQSAGFAGANIANICNEAALIAARNERDYVINEDMMNALDRTVAGLEKKSRKISDEEKEIISYHEAGHAVISHLLKNVDDLVKVSIIPRGRSLGANWYMPQERNIVTKKQLFDKMCATLGGRAAEEIVFDEISSGALDDLEKVTKMAYSMVSIYGLSEKVGNLSFHDSTGENQQSLQKPYSEYLGKKIDEEVQLVIHNAYERAKLLLKDEREALNRVAELLLDREVILKKDVDKIFTEVTV